MARLYGVETNCTREQINNALRNAAVLLSSVPDEPGGIAWLAERDEHGTGDGIQDLLCHRMGFESNPMRVIRNLCTKVSHG